MFERYTVHFHLRAAAGQGAMSGVLMLNEYVARKELGATRWHILALLLIPASAQLLAVIGNPASGTGRLARRPFRTFGVAIHALLFLPVLLWIPWSPWAFVGVVATVLVSQALLIPIQNSIVARNYAAARRGRLFGRAVGIQSLSIVVVSVGFGFLLDYDAGLWRVGYAVAAGAAMFAYLQWGRLRRRRHVVLADQPTTRVSAWHVLRTDRKFFAFEMGFMLYGLGFLALQPVLPLFFVDEVHVDYGDIGLARGAVFWTVMVLMAPLVGRLGDRIGIVRLGALGFLCVSLFPLTLILMPNRIGLYVGYGLFGVAMSAVNVAWNLGPITLARGRDPIPYLNAHIAAIGVRAIVAMSIATAVHQAVGTVPVFIGVIVLEIIAAVLMLRLAPHVAPEA